MAVSVSTPPHGGGVSDAPIDLCDDSSGPTGADDSEDGEDTAFASGPQTMKSVVPEAFGSRATRGAEEGVDGGAGGASAPDVATERAAAQSLSEHQIRARDKYYVVPKKWFDEWENYASFGDNGIIAPPGAIDMAQILEADGEPQKALYHESDYEVVPEELWLLLKRRYGVGTGIEIARTAVINTGTRRATVPLYPLIVHVLRPGMAECEKSKIRIFASATLQELKEKACAELGIASDANPKLCSFIFGEAEDEHNDLTKTLAETAVSKFDDFLIKTDADGDDGSQGSLGNTAVPPPSLRGSLEDLINGGFLYKAGEEGVFYTPSWKKRFFQLEGKLLKYYDKEPAAGGTYKGEIDLDQVNLDEPIVTVPGAEQEFKLRTSGRDWHFRWDNDCTGRSADTWKQGFLSVVKRASQRLSEMSRTHSEC